MIVSGEEVNDTKRVINCGRIHRPLTGMRDKILATAAPTLQSRRTSKPSL